MVGECANGREALAAIRQQAPELVFLDVQMPGMNGFDVVEEIGPDQMPVVLFVTAYETYALRAFEAHALDNLLKPIDDERFDCAVRRACHRIEERRQGEIARRLAEALDEVRQGSARAPVSGAHPAERFLVPAGGGLVVVPVGDVDWVEAQGDYVALHVGSTAHLLRETLTAIEARLDARRFARIHRSASVNAERICALEPHVNRELVVILRDGTRLKASRSYRERLEALHGGP